MAIALYRKYRPQSFEEMVGQRAVVTGLKNALEMGKWVHAYLFSGPRGSGKTTAARILAKALNCLQAKEPTPTPCGTCEICSSIRDGRCLDVIEMDAASNRGIDEIRNLKESVAFQPSVCRYKVYIIDEAHMLTAPAFNALLKTLEEPPADVVFILCTTEAHKIPLTILSRCQRYDFTRLPAEDMFTLLQRVVQEENYTLEEGVFDLLYAHSEGAARDALSLLEQLAIYTHNHITRQAFLELLGIPQKQFYFDLLSALSNRDFSQTLSLSRRACEMGLSFWNFLNIFTSLLRDLLATRQGIPPSDLYREEEQARLTSIASSFSTADLFTLFDRLGHFRYVFKWETEGRLLWDIAFLTLFHSLAEGTPLPAGEAKERGAIQMSAPDKQEAPSSPLPPEREEKISVKEEKKLPVNEKPPEFLFREEKEGYEPSPAVNEPVPTEPAGETGSPKIPINLDWRGFYSALKVQSPVLAGLLSSATVQELSSSRLVVSFPPSFSFPRIYLKKLSVRRELEERLKEFFQQDIAFRIVESAEVLPQEVETSRQQVEEATMEGEIMIQRILNYFPGSQRE